MSEEDNKPIVWRDGTPVTPAKTEESNELSGLFADEGEESSSLWVSRTSDVATQEEEAPVETFSGDYFRQSDVAVELFDQEQGDDWLSLAGAEAERYTKQDTLYRYVQDILAIALSGDTQLQGVVNSFILTRDPGIDAEQKHRYRELMRELMPKHGISITNPKDFDTVLDAADRLRDERVRFVLVGSGGQRGRLEREIKARDLANVIMLPYQPFETLNDSLNACDASLVSIAEGIEGISFPSKFYSSLAVAKPIVAISEEDSELRRAVESSDCGVWARSGDGVGLAQAILALARDPERCAASGRRARELMEREYTVTACAARYAEILDACAMESR